MRNPIKLFKNERSNKDFLRINVHRNQFNANRDYIETQDAIILRNPRYIYYLNLEVPLESSYNDLFRDAPRIRYMNDLLWEISSSIDFSGMFRF